MINRSSNYFKVTTREMAKRYRSWQDAENDLWIKEDQFNGNIYIVNHKLQQILTFSLFEVSFFTYLANHNFVNGEKAGRKEILANVKFK